MEGINAGICYETQIIMRDTLDKGNGSEAKISEFRSSLSKAEVYRACLPAGRAASVSGLHTYIKQSLPGSPHSPLL